MKEEKSHRISLIKNKKINYNVKIIQTFQKNGLPMVYKDNILLQTQILIRIVILMNPNTAILKKIKVKSPLNL